MRAARRERLLLLTPAAALLLLVVAVPIVRVVALSFTRVELAEGWSVRWAGLSTLARLLHDGRYLGSLKNTAVFTGASVALETLLGVALALLLDRRFPGRRFVRTVAILPWALPTAVMALGWAWIFNDTFGVANDLLRRAGLTAQPIAWLSGPGSAMAALVVADVWKTTPFVALIVLAGLQAIPADVLEAARVDGLTAAQRLRSVVLPLLLPAIAVAAIFRAVQAFGAFDLVWVMTGGGPGGSTETVSLYAFTNDFRYLDFGYGSAVATVSVALAAVAAAAAARLVRSHAGAA